jgi:hypothetical protein
MNSGMQSVVRHPPGGCGIGFEVFQRGNLLGFGIVARIKHGLISNAQLIRELSYFVISAEGRL